MRLKKLRDRFVELSNEMIQDEELKAVVINPEIVQLAGQKFVFLLINDNMNDKEEVEKIIMQSVIEDFGFLIIFENDPGNFANLLILTLSQLKFVDPSFPLHFLLYKDETDTFDYLQMSISESEEGNEVS